MENIFRLKLYFFFPILLLFISLRVTSQNLSVVLTQEEKRWISDHPTVNVANEMDWPPFDFVKDEKPAGYSIDLIKLIAQKTGLNINLVNGYTWNELVEQFIKGKIQILPAVYKDDERKTFMEFTSSYFTQPSVLVINSNKKINSISDLSNKNIAVIEGFSITTQLESLYPDINRVPVKSILDGLMKVSTGELDGFIESIGVVSYFKETNFIPNLKIISDVQLDKMDSPPLYMSVSKDNIILRNILQKGLDDISKKEMNAIRDKWITIDVKRKENIQIKDLLTVEERQWISSHPVINVGSERDWPPIDFVIEGKPMGYGIDLIELISKELGFKINYINGFTWSELLEKFRSGEIDIMPAISKTNDRLEYIKFSESYINLPYVKVINSENQTSQKLDLGNKRAAVIKGSNVTKALIKKYPNIDTLHVEKIIDGIKKVSTGEVDLYIENLGVISYYLEQSYFPNIKLDSENLNFLEYSDVYIGVLKNNEILGSLIEKGLNAISDEDIKTLREKWLPVNVATNQNEEVVKSYDLWKAIIGILILFISLYFGFKWLFKKIIKEEVALEFGSKRFRVKTNFYLGILLVVIAALGWLATVYIEAEFKQNIKLQLENDLGSANGRLEFWLNQKKEHLKSLGNDQKLVNLTNDLVEVYANYTKEQYNLVHNKLLQFFDEHHYQGNYIIDEEGFNIGAIDTSYVGKSNSIIKNQPELLKKVFKGEVVFIPPFLLSENKVTENTEGNVISYMYFLIPIENTEDKVIAAIIQKIDPSHGFSDILQLSHVGETGESYIFSHEGIMLSESRFEKDLIKLGVFQVNNDGKPYVEIKDPEGDLTKGFIPNEALSQKPFTLMAKSALEGNKDVNVDGYNDYRGVPVMGAWMWIDKLELGLATEIDVEEALDLFYFIRLSAIIVLGITLIFIIGSILFTLNLGEKANVALINAKEELEDRVLARTTELDNEKSLLGSLIDAIPDLIFYKDTNFNFLGANKAFERQIGHKIVDLIGKKDDSFIPLELAEKFEKSDAIIIEKSEAVSMESEDVDPDGNKIVFDTKKTPFFNEKGKLLGLIGISRDITLRKKAELRLKSQSAALKSAANSVVISNTKGEIVWVNPAFTKLTGYTWREVVGKNPRALNSGKHDKAFFSKMWNTILTGKTWQGEVINKKKNGELYYEEMTITPVLDEKGEIAQFVAIKHDITERKKLEEVMKKANERMESELNVAKDIQMSMLPLIFPAFPKRDEVDLYAELIPAREVGGDFYDFHFIDENHLCIVMADVSGKGVPAALMMAVTKTLLKSRASNDKSPASILTDVNNEIAKDNDSYMFITVFLAILNTNTGELIYSNAGHNPSYIISNENKKLTKLGDLHGPVIGAMEGMTYGETKLLLKKNDIVFSYTDGVTESHNINAELYSDPRLEELLENGDYDSSEKLVKIVIESVKEFEGEADQFDDITAMAIEYRHNPNTVSSIKSTIEIKNDLKQIATAIEWFEAFALENEMPFGIIQKINIAFDELLNNIISYGYDDEDVHQIDVEIELRSERLIIIIKDDGVPFNPFKKDPPDTMLSVEERMIGGLGIHLVKKLMDEYEYKRHTDKNIITLIKHNINT